MIRSVFCSSSNKPRLRNPFGWRTGWCPDLCYEFGISSSPQLCPCHGRLTLDRHRHLPRIRPRPDLGEARPRTRGRSLQAPHAENDLPHAGCGKGNGATAGFHLTRRMGFPPVSPWIPAVFVITAIMAVQLALTLLAKNLLARKLDNSQIFNRYIPSYPQ